ncbi:MAG: hypothetical protein RIQ33_1125 [Bacteroidota bacterium]|jgi:hypothetical protein
MNFTQFKQSLSSINELTILLPDNSLIPQHFHITEVGLITKHFIDCGGKERINKLISFQLWVAEDVKHRLSPERVTSILNQSAFITGNADFEIEVEYQTNTIGKYGIEFNGQYFQLTNKFTECLAAEVCGTQSEKYKLNLADIEQTSCCVPGGGCC